MKKLIYIVFLFCLIGNAKTITVGKSYPVKTIKQAIALANDGDTIIVTQGVYKEGTIIIKKKIKFIGKNFPVIDGQNKAEVLSVVADSVVVKGFKIINSGYATLNDPSGIKVYDRNFVVIENNILDNNFFGIYLQNCKNSIVTAYWQRNSLLEKR
jgi:nitrous oxidase accessory protein